MKGNLGEVATLLVNGNNMDNGTTIKIIHSSGLEITGQNVATNKSSIEADFDLTGVPTGFWDIIITNSSGDSIRQKNGFEVR
jgi:hypothetical protein